MQTNLYICLHKILIMIIIKFPNPTLKKKALFVTKITDTLIYNIENMINTMKKSNGIGLAATQVNINKRIIIIKFEKIQKIIPLINPQIINKNFITESLEGCLSFPNIFVKIKRYKNITIKYNNIKKETKTIKATNIDSFCIQHEIDHINGITIYDHMNYIKKKIILKKMNE